MYTFSSLKIFVWSARSGCSGHCNWCSVWLSPRVRTWNSVVHLWSARHHLMLAGFLLIRSLSYLSNLTSMAENLTFAHIVVIRWKNCQIQLKKNCGFIIISSLWFIIFLLSKWPVVTLSHLFSNIFLVCQVTKWTFETKKYLRKIQTNLLI